MEGEYLFELMSNFWGYYAYENSIYVEGHDEIESKTLADTYIPSFDGSIKRKKWN